MQLPNSLLQYGPPLQHCIQQSIPSAQAYILCDNLKHSCCLDLVGANHISCYDCIIHIGEACYSEEIPSIDVYYLFPQDLSLPTSTLLAIQQYLSSSSMPVDFLISQRHDAVSLKQKIGAQNTCYYYGLKEWLDQQKREEKRELVVIEEKGSAVVENVLYASREYAYEGVRVADQNGLHDLANLRDDLLFKRYSLIEKTKRHSTYGVLFSNANNPAQVQIGRKCKSLLQAAGKKVYSFVINSLNEAKLNNFAEVDCFVVVSCSLHSLLPPKLYYKDILCPYELLLCLEEIPWKSAVLTHPIRVAPLFRPAQPIKDSLSMVNRQLAAVHPDQRQVATLQKQLFQNLEQFQDKSFQGLDINQQVEVHLAQEGLSGIASGYQQEKE